MRGSFSEQIVLATGVLALLLVGLTSPAARAASQPERLTTAQRKELEQRAIELRKAAVQLYQRGEPAPALENMRRALQILERLYSKSEYPDGHADLAGCLGWVGGLLKAQGAYGEARVYLERAAEMDQMVYSKEQHPQGHLDLATSIEQPGWTAQGPGGATVRRIGHSANGRWRCSRAPLPQATVSIRTS